MISSLLEERINKSLINAIPRPSEILTSGVSNGVKIRFQDKEQKREAMMFINALASEEEIKYEAILIPISESGSQTAKRIPLKNSNKLSRMEMDKRINLEKI